MLLTLNKTELAGALAALGKLVSRTSLIKTYQAIQIEGRANTLYFRTRNVVEEIEFRMDADLENDFPAALVEFEQFRLAVRNCKKKTLELAVENGEVFIENVKLAPGNGCIPVSENILAKVEENYFSFQRCPSVFSTRCQVAYSVKANINRKIIETISKCNGFFEVSSYYDFLKLKEYKVDGKKIIVNVCFMKTNEMLEVLHSGARLIIDSLMWIRQLAACKERMDLGIRLNLDYIKSEVEHSCLVSRFGLFRNDLSELQGILKENPQIHITGLHCHFSGNTRSPDVYVSIIRELVRIAQTPFLNEISYLDIGGGYKTPKWSPEMYYDALFHAISINDFRNYTFILEPGNAIVRTAGRYYVKVVGVKKTGSRFFVFTDGSKLHLNNRQIPPSDVIITSNGERIETPQIIVGNTCKESDVLTIVENQPLLRVDDIVAFDHVGAYDLLEHNDYLLAPPQITYSHLLIK